MKAIVFFLLITSVLSFECHGDPPAPFAKCETPGVWQLHDTLRNVSGITLKSSVYSSAQILIDQWSLEKNVFIRAPIIEIGTKGLNQIGLSLDYPFVVKDNPPFIPVLIANDTINWSPYGTQLTVLINLDIPTTKNSMYLTFACYRKAIGTPPSFIFSIKGKLHVMKITLPSIAERYCPSSNYSYIAFALRRSEDTHSSILVPVIVILSVLLAIVVMCVICGALREWNIHRTSSQYTQL